MKIVSSRFIITLIVILFSLIPVYAFHTDIGFYRLHTTDGLSSSQVNHIMKDSRGYIWVSTQSGLDRYDGFRFKVFYNRADDKTTIPVNTVQDVQEDSYGQLWVHTPIGYSILHVESEKFEQDPQEWMGHFGMKGWPSLVYIAKNKDMWLGIAGQGLYYLRRGASRAAFFPMKGRGASAIPYGSITSICEAAKGVVLSYGDGTLAKIDPMAHKVLWVNTYLKVDHRYGEDSYTTYVDRFGNYWVTSSGRSIVYESRQKRWYSTVNEYLRSKGYDVTVQDPILIKDLEEDNKGVMWVATDHEGLLRLFHDDLSAHWYRYDKGLSSSISDNTLQSIFADKNGALWVGTYKNGICYSSSSFSRFQTIDLGDICSIAEDKAGVLWCGTNNDGIVAYNPLTKARRSYRHENTGLGSNTVVSALCSHDGTLWFGTYNGGMARYRDGQWKVYRANDKSGLRSDNVWSLCEARDGRIVLGTLGAGVQVLDPSTDTFTTYTAAKNGLGSDYISSVAMDNHGNVIAAHSANYSILDLKTGRVSGYKGKYQFLSTFFNQVAMDSRGIIWAATTSGMNAYEPKTGRMIVLDWQVGTTGSIGCSVIEDRNHMMWLVSDHGVAKVILEKSKDYPGGYDYGTIGYNEFDGLQDRQFNFRSILLAHNGNIIIGGQDGINVINPYKTGIRENKAKAIFSGLVVFDKLLNVGKKYHGRVVLDRNMNYMDELELKHDENAFTIQLASSEVVVPQKSRFRYRLKGFSDKWLVTADGQPSITYTNLSPGHYTLEVMVIGREGVVSDAISRLNIVIAPPFYLTIWAFLLYAVILSACVYFYNRYMYRRRQDKIHLHKVEAEAKRNREMDDMKLTFYTNVSHELRTPLTLIISPLSAIIKKEQDPDKKTKLQLVHRNAERLLSMVNQILDFRKMDGERDTLQLATGDIVGYVQNIFNSFRTLINKDMEMSFTSTISSLMMSFDPDKMRKIVDNLMSNALKYTDQGGRIAVRLSVEVMGKGKEDQLVLSVSDTGIGVPDDDKAHIFDRFYQAKNHTENPFGGSGVGLSLVKDFVTMHDGTINVVDNPGGGTVFVVHLPIRHDVSLKRILTDNEVKPEYVDNKTFTDEHAVAPVDKQEIASVQQGENKQYEVLIVDDSDDFLSFMSEELSDRYRIRIAHNGQEALNRIIEHHPDIILSDVMMPVMDGTELCKRLKSNKDTRHIPLVMLTARLAPEHKIEGMSVGADDYLTKPFNMDLLYLRIENLIKWHNATPASKAGKIQPELKPMEITSLDEELVRKATEYVEKNLRDSSITVETMSQELGMSRVNLYKRLLSITGSTPSEFIRQIRLRRSEQLLREGQYSVSEVAYMVGFNNPRYFSKYFKEMYGTMPSQYSRK